MKEGESTLVKRSRLLWQNGAYVDLWTVVHIVMGVLLGLVLEFVGTSLVTALISALALAVLWEVWERVRMAGESFTNQVVDVVAFVLGVWFVYMFNPQSRSAIVILLAFFGVLRVVLKYLAEDSYRWRQRKGLP